MIGKERRSLGCRALCACDREANHDRDDSIELERPECGGGIRNRKV